MALTVLNYGASGTGKTTQAGRFAQYEYVRTGKPGRLVTAEEWHPIQPLVDVGLISVFPLVTVPLGNRFWAMRKLAQGWWTKPNDPTKLVAPDSSTWTKVGWYIVEGLTSVSDILMDEARRCGYSVGEAPAGGSFTQADEKFQNQSRSQYTLVQKEALTIIKTFAALPVDRVLFTAHETRGEEDDTRMPIIGPGLAGKAATDKVPGWVGDCLHSDYRPEEVTILENGKKIPVTRSKIQIYFMSHPDWKQANVTYKCKPRVSADKIPALLKEWPGGYLSPTVSDDGEMTDGLDEFLKMEDELVRTATAGAKAWKEKVDTMIGMGKGEAA